MYEQKLRTSTPKPTSAQLAAGLVIVAGLLSMGSATWGTAQGATRPLAPSVGSNMDLGAAVTHPRTLAFGYRTGSSAMRRAQAETVGTTTDDEVTVTRAPPVPMGISSSGSSSGAGLLPYPTNVEGPPYARRESFVFGEYNDAPEWGQEAAIDAAFQVSMGSTFVFDFWVGNTNSVLSGIAPVENVGAAAALKADMNTFFLENNQSSAYLIATHSDGAVTAAYAVGTLLASFPSVSLSACSAAGQTPANQTIIVFAQQPSINGATITTMQSALGYNYPGTTRRIYDVGGSCVTFDVFWSLYYDVGDEMTYDCMNSPGVVDGEACYLEILESGVITGGGTTPYPFANPLEPGILANVDTNASGPVHDATSSSAFQNGACGPMCACGDWTSCL